MTTKIIGDDLLVTEEGKEIWNRIDSMVNSIFEAFPDVAPQDVAHLVSSSAFTVEAVRRLKAGLEINRRRRELKRQQMEDDLQRGAEETTSGLANP